MCNPVRTKRVHTPPSQSTSQPLDAQKVKAKLEKFMASQQNDSAEVMTFLNSFHAQISNFSPEIIGQVIDGIVATTYQETRQDYPARISDLLKKLRDSLPRLFHQQIPSNQNAMQDKTTTAKRTTAKKTLSSSRTQAYPNKKPKINSRSHSSTKLTPSSTHENNVVYKSRLTTVRSESPSKCTQNLNWNNNNFGSGTKLKQLNLNLPNLLATKFQSCTISHSVFYAPRMNESTFFENVTFNHATLNGTKFGSKVEEEYDEAKWPQYNKIDFTLSTGTLTLKSIKFEDANFKKSTFENLVLLNVKLFKHRMDAVTIEKATFSNVLFADSFLNGSVIDKATFQGLRIVKSDMSGIRIENATFSGDSCITDTNMYKAIITNTEFYNIKITDNETDGNFQDTNIQNRKTNLTKAEITNCKFYADSKIQRIKAPHSIWTDVSFNQCQIKDACFQGATFTNVSLKEKISLVRVDFSSAIMNGLDISAATKPTDLNFSHATLTENTSPNSIEIKKSKFDHCEISNAQFQMVSFQKVSLEGVTFKHVNFHGCDFIQCNIFGITICECTTGDQRILFTDAIIVEGYKCSTVDDMYDSSLKVNSAKPTRQNITVENNPRIEIFFFELKLTGSIINHSPAEKEYCIFRIEQCGVSKLKFQNNNRVTVNLFDSNFEDCEFEDNYLQDPRIGDVTFSETTFKNGRLENADICGGITFRHKSKLENVNIINTDFPSDQDIVMNDSSITNLTISRPDKEKDIGFSSNITLENVKAKNLVFKDIDIEGQITLKNSTVSITFEGNTCLSGNLILQGNSKLTVIIGGTHTVTGNIQKDSKSKIKKPIITEGGKLVDKREKVSYNLR